MSDAPESALIVTDSGSGAEDLAEALAADGILATVLSPAAVLARGEPAAGHPDIVLLSSDLDIDTVRAVIRRVGHPDEHAPTVVSFAGHDADELDSHVQEGLDFLPPPYVPYLVRNRLVVSRRHHDLRRDLHRLQSADRQHRHALDLQTAREIQQGFLPQELPDVPGWQIAAHFAPAREVSGDFYDAYGIINGSRIGFAIADVCDKGVGAAMFMALIRSLLRHAAATGDAAGTLAGSPAGAATVQHAVRTTNDYLTAHHLHQAYFATLFFGIVNPATGELVYINCGHDPPIVRRADGSQLRLAPTGPAVGLIHNATFALGRTTLHPGDLLLLYTDGVTESRDPGGAFYGEQRVRHRLADAASAEETLTRIEQDLVRHRGTAEQYDDVTMLALRRMPR